MGRNRVVRMVVLALVLGLAMGSVAFAAPSTPSRSDVPQGVWTGKTSQGLKLRFDVLLSNHGLIVQPNELDADLVCSGTGSEIGAGFLFLGFHANVGPDGSFGFRLYDELFGTVSFKGTLGNTSGSGTELIAIPGLTRDLGAETCSSGNVTWTARPPGGGIGSRTAPALTYRITFTKDRSGHVTESITR